VFDCVETRWDWVCKVRFIYSTPIKLRCPLINPLRSASSLPALAPGGLPMGSSVALAGALVVLSGVYTHSEGGRWWGIGVGRCVEDR